MGAKIILPDAPWIRARAVARPPLKGLAIERLRRLGRADLPALWITLADDHLYWAFSNGPIEAGANPTVDGPSRFRRTKDGWHRRSLTGEAMARQSLSSALTRTANYQMTICRVAGEDYLLRRIRGDENPLHDEAQTMRTQMGEIAARMIRQLDWEDFETLVDLIFSRNGWRRTSILGRNQPDVDLIVAHPVTGETAWVQVKSSARQQELEENLEGFRRSDSFQRFYFVCHTPDGTLCLPGEPHLHLWTAQHLADVTIAAGLFDWLIARTR